MSATQRRRVDRLEADTVLLFCRDPWHRSEAARFAVVYEDVETRETPSPPSCPSCGGEPDLTIVVGYERVSPALDGGIELRRTTVKW